jgi:hypothetical protein
MERLVESMYRRVMQRTVMVQYQVHTVTWVLVAAVQRHHAQAALPPGKTRYPLYRRLGGPQGPSGRVQKISPPPEFDPRTVQLVVSPCTD